MAPSNLTIFGIAVLLNILSVSLINIFNATGLTTATPGSFFNVYLVFNVLVLLYFILPKKVGGVWDIEA